MDSNTSFIAAGRPSSRVSSGSGDLGGTFAEDARSAASRPHRGIGALASSIRDVVRDTVYVTIDALRGRYDG
jgi:hypothetical protein